ncbi:MAG: hypothetical protein QOF76_1692 [Solirubrobacteraceae bacterium]|nr:hypothetical protein [Solirubrobacteraceae bacterium]
MRRAAAAALLVAGLAGCGGGEVAAPSGPPAAPIAEQVKLDVRTAAIYLEAHHATDGTYTTNLGELPAGFPADVRITSADADGFVVEGVAAGGGRFTLTFAAEAEVRTCAPASKDCEGGSW